MRGVHRKVAGVSKDDAQSGMSISYSHADREAGVVVVVVVVVFFVGRWDSGDTLSGWDRGEDGV